MVNNYLKVYKIKKIQGGYKIMKKSTGVVRKVDELGRIVIPIELRRTLDINEKDSLEIFVDGDQIILKKYEPACIFCGDAKNVVNYKGKNICKSCLKELKGGK
jgi:transcriptional pleiotropic regulator of transition state genes